MIKRTITIVLAFIGIIVGAGFATGQEMLQYFVSYGKIGILAAFVSAITVAISGLVVVQLGSYYLAGDHGTVLRHVSHPFLAHLLDLGVLVTLFSTGTVMFAGAGSNLNQQFHIPTWVGSLIMLVLVLIVGLLDVDRVTEIIGALTPFIIVFITITAIWVLSTPHADPVTLEQAAHTITPVGTHWLISALNYVGLNLMIGASMAIIIGGNNPDPRAAGLGGFLGGIMFGLMLTAATWALYLRSNQVAADDVPMLTIVNQIHPWLGFGMSLAILGMIFNTVIGMLYAFGKRITASRPKRFYPAFVVSSCIAFGFSFLGFKTLLSVVFPILGYIGILLFLVFLVGWLRSFSKIQEESLRRKNIRELLCHKLDPNKDFSPKQQHQLKRHQAESNVADADIAQTMRAEVQEELGLDADAGTSKSSANS